MWFLSIVIVGSIVPLVAIAIFHRKNRKDRADAFVGWASTLFATLVGVSAAAWVTTQQIEQQQRSQLLGLLTVVAREASSIQREVATRRELMEIDAVGETLLFYRSPLVPAALTSVLASPDLGQFAPETIPHLVAHSRLLANLGQALDDTPPETNPNERQALAETYIVELSHLDMLLMLTEARVKREISAVEFEERVEAINTARVNRITREIQVPD